MNQPAFARRVVLTVIACTLALSSLWLRLTNPSDIYTQAGRRYSQFLHQRLRKRASVRHFFRRRQGQRK